MLFFFLFDKNFITGIINRLFDLEFAPYLYVLISLFKDTNYYVIIIISNVLLFILSHKLLKTKNMILLLNSQ